MLRIQVGAEFKALGKYYRKILNHMYPLKRKILNHMYPLKSAKKKVFKA